MNGERVSEVINGASPAVAPLSGPPQLDGKVAIVTGAARGIGRAICLTLGRAGCSVVPADVARLDETIAELRTYEVPASPEVVDVTRREDVDRLVARAISTFGRVDVLVNNAGVVERKGLLDLDDSTFQRTIDISLRGTYLCTQAVYPHMRSQGGGKIVNISSISGKGGGGAVSSPSNPGAAAAGRSGAAYAAAKGGVISFTRWVALEVGHHGIHCNAVCPGPVDSAMTAGFDYGVERQPIPRMGSPVDIAFAVLFFASDMSNYITGQTLNVDGGRVMD